MIVYDTTLLKMLISFMKQDKDDRMAINHLVVKTNLLLTYLPSYFNRQELIYCTASLHSKCILRWQ